MSTVLGFKYTYKPELPVAASTGLLSHHLVYGGHQVNCTTETLALRIGQLAFNSA